MTSAEMSTADHLLDVVMPGDQDYPIASAIGLGLRLAGHDRFGPATAAMVALLPDGFGAWQATEKTQSVAALESSHPDTFAAFITGVYSLYYSDPAVLAVIARTTGYTPHAPQPHGYALDPFDPAILAVVAARPRQYRDIGDVKND